MSVAIPGQAGVPGDVYLSDAHREELEHGSCIDPEVIAERGYRTVSRDSIPSQFPDYQRSAGLLIPIRDAWGQVGALQMKPDRPRLKGGKPIKYETVPGASLCLDVPRRVLPHLGNPKVPLWITEGAKKVDSALSNGITGVIGLNGVYGWRGTNGDGGKAALPDWEAVALNGRKVVLAFDSDCMTKKEVRGALLRLGDFLKIRGAEIGYCIMPDLPDESKCGLDDFFAQGKTYEDLRQCIIRELPKVRADRDEPVLLWAYEVESEEIDWLWDGWIPKRMLTILGGYGGDGKSTMMTSIIGALTSGNPLPDGTARPQTNVLMLSAEDDPSYAIRPRLEAHGAHLERVVMMKGTQTGNGPERWPDLRRDVGIMERVVQEHEIGLIVVDPLSSYLPQSDRNSEGDIRDALQPLLGLMERTGVAIVGIMHVGKSADGRRAAQRLLGSTAFTALARSVLMVADLPEDRQPDDWAMQGKHKVVQVVKSNYAIAPPPLLFRRPKDLAIQWFGESALGIEECLGKSGAGRPGRSPLDRMDAEALLRELLKGGSVPTTEVMKEARSLGISERTMKRAKAALGIEALKIGYSGTWHWRFPLAPKVPEEGQKPAA